MIKLLLDMGLPRRTAADLRAAGWDAVHVGDIDWTTAKDAEILALAAEQERTVVTLDSDFGKLLAASGAARPSVIHIRMEGLKRELATSLLKKLVPQLQDDLLKGSLASVTATNVRVRNLPL